MGLDQDRLRLASASLALAALSLLVPMSAQADRALPVWSSYQSSRSLAEAVRAWGEGKPQAALQAAHRGVDLDPSSALGYWVLAQLQVQTAQWADAANNLHTLLARGDLPDELSRLDLALLAGRVAVERGLEDQAEHHFNWATIEDPEDPRGPLGLALAAARLKPGPGQGPPPGEETTLEAVQSHLIEVRRRSPSYDLSQLLLKAEWATLADDEDLVSVLEAVLAAPTPTDEATPPSTKPPLPKE